MTSQVVFPVELGLTPTEVPLALLLVQRERVSVASAYAVLYSARTRKPEARTVKVHVSHLRKKFGKLSLRIETIWGWGWKMPPADRERLRSLISRIDIATRET
jgi:DNA-binding response OmpR family regulator